MKILTSLRIFFLLFRKVLPNNHKMQLTVCTESQTWSRPGIKALSQLPCSLLTWPQTLINTVICSHPWFTHHLYTRYWLAWCIFFCCCSKSLDQNWLRYFICEIHWMLRDFSRTWCQH